MKIFCLLASMFLFCSVSNADAVNCGSGYGPDQKNLAAVMDDEGGDNIQIGYSTIGTFFPMRLAGCSKLTMKSQAIFCGARQVGVASEVFVANDDLGWNGPRVSISLKSAEITGSCRPTDHMPLTLTIR